jgi:hypothetical protein
MLVGMRVRAWLVATLLGTACSHPAAPAAVPVVGPDGSAMLHVSCANDEAACYRLAGEHCPFGYSIARSAGEPGNFLVRCRDVRTASGSTWPPNAELLPSPYGPASNVAWPPPQEVPPSPYTSAPARQQQWPPLAPGSKDDVGY